jgi:hypothetical protein
VVDDYGEDFADAYSGLVCRRCSDRAVTAAGPQAGTRFDE